MLLCYEDIFQLIRNMHQGGGLDAVSPLSGISEDLVPVCGTDWGGLGDWRSASLGVGFDNLKTPALSTSVSASCLWFET